MNKTLPTNAGFSLLELTIVVAIVGILSGLSIVTFSHQLRKERLKASTRDAVSWIESIQSKAIQQNKICEITINKQLNTASMTSDAHSEVAAEDRCTGISTYPLESAITSLTPDPSSSSTCLLSTGNETLRITFTARGTLPCGGEIRLISEDNKTTRCINLTAPLGVIREGLLNQGSGSCDYTTAH